MDEVLLRALLRARAKNAVVLLRGGEDGAALANGQRHRLLEEHVLSGAARLNGHLRMPEIRRGDQDAVNRRVGEQLAIILITPRVGHEVALLHALPGKFLLHAPHARKVYVRERDEVAVRLASVPQAGRHVECVRDASAPDHAERKLLRRRSCA